jgi:hypothetical protein
MKIGFNRNEEVKENNEVKENKIMTGVKKHGKKILIGLGVAAAAVGGYVLGKRNSATDDEDFDTEEEFEGVEVTEDEE